MREVVRRFLSTQLGLVDADLDVLVNDRLGHHRVTVFVVPAGESVPRICVKASQTPADRSLLNEFQVLRRLHSSPGAEHSAPVVPSALGCYHDEAGTLVATTVLDGVPWPPSPGVDSGRSSTRRWIKACGTLADALQQLTQVQSADTPQESSADASVRRFLQSRPDIARSVGSLWVDRCARLPRYQRSWQHGDLAPGNLLRCGTTVGVLDWELAGGDYEPWFDLCYPLCLQNFETGRLALDLLTNYHEAVMKPRWVYPVPPLLALATTAIQAAERAQALDRGSGRRWSDVAGRFLEAGSGSNLT